ncbi:MAG: Hpt domain-containing protein, partial [Syntrophomonadaceae bacterium]|nr:Hpt domain-containing protein [Syntrophomonadaceae bacterium]
MKMDTSQYLDLFLEESKEHLGELNQKLLDLEKSPQDIATLNDIFRSAHTLKGMSSTMGFDSLADLTHHMEDVLSDLKEGALVADSFVVNTLFQAFDRLQLMIDNIEEENHTAVDNSDLIQILSNIKNNISENVTGAISSPPGQDHKEGFELNEYDLTIL